MTDTPINGNELEDPATDSAQVDNGTTATVDELDVHNGEPDRPKFTDAAGVTRVGGPPTEGFTPAPVDPTPDQIAANKAFHQSDASAGFAPPDDFDANPASYQAPPVEPNPEAAVNGAAGDANAADTTTPAPADAVPDGDQAAVEAAAAAAADAEVQAEVDADRAQAAAEEAAADAAALTEAEAKEVKDEEATS